MPAAQFSEPQQGRTSRAASSSDNPFQQASTLFTHSLLSGKLFKKLGYKVACHDGAISSGRANVVDGPNFFRYAFSCGLGQRRLDSFSGEHALRFHQAQRNGRNAPHREAYIPNRAASHLAKSGEADLGNRLRVASSNLARMRNVSGESAREQNFSNQFVTGQK